MQYMYQHRESLSEWASFQQWRELVEFISSVRFLFDQVHRMEDKLWRHISRMRGQCDLCGGGTGTERWKTEEEQGEERM